MCKAELEHFASTTSASVLRGERYSAGLFWRNRREQVIFHPYEVLQSRLIDASEPLLMLMLMNQIDVQRSTAPTGHPLFASPMFGVFAHTAKGDPCARCSASPCELEFLCRQGTRDRPSPPFAHPTTFIAPLIDENGKSVNMSCRLLPHQDSERFILETPSARSPSGGKAGLQRARET
jgi:hypothetical protein